MARSLLEEQAICRLLLDSLPWTWQSGIELPAASPALTTPPVASPQPAKPRARPVSLTSSEAEARYSSARDILLAEGGSPALTNSDLRLVRIAGAMQACGRHTAQPASLQVLGLQGCTGLSKLNREVRRLRHLQCTRSGLQSRAGDLLRSQNLLALVAKSELLDAKSPALQNRLVRGSRCRRASACLAN